jgi:hypothetical protein
LGNIGIVGRAAAGGALAFGRVAGPPPPPIMFDRLKIGGFDAKIARAGRATDFYIQGEQEWQIAF